MPDPMSGLGLSDSRNVPEGEHAIYKCMKDDHHVPGTPDGVFRVPCKRSGAFEQSMRTNWTACQVKPAKACTPLPQPGDGYKLVGPELLYTAEGQIVEFECEKPGYLAGNAKLPATSVRMTPMATLSDPIHSQVNNETKNHTNSVIEYIIELIQ